MVFVFQVCPEGGGDKNAGCRHWKKLGFCLPGQNYYQYVTKTCPASCELCQGLSETEKFTVLYSCISASLPVLYSTR